MVDIKRQAANFTVDGLHVVSDIFTRIDTVILFEGAVKGVIIRKTAFGRDGRDWFFFHQQQHILFIELQPFRDGRDWFFFHQQSFGFQQPLLDDILVKTDLHILLEHVGKIVFVNEKRLCHRVQRKIAAEVQIDIMQGVAQDACFLRLGKNVLSIIQGAVDADQDAENVGHALTVVCVVAQPSGF